MGGCFSKSTEPSGKALEAATASPVGISVKAQNGIAKVPDKATEQVCSQSDLQLCSKDTPTSSRQAGPEPVSQPFQQSQAAYGEAWHLPGPQDEAEEGAAYNHGAAQALPVDTTPEAVSPSSITPVITEERLSYQPDSWPHAAQKDWGNFQGAPQPEEEDDRCRVVNSIQIHPTAPEARFDHVTSLMCSIFKMPLSVISILDNQCTYFKSTSDPGFKLPPFDNRIGFCSWTLLPRDAEVLVFEDTLLDARTRESIMVTGPPHARFWAGCPLVTSAGVRIGTLFVSDYEPRQFDASCCAILANFAEMVVREIEHESRMAAESKAADQALEVRNRLQAAMEAGRTGVVLVDVESPQWDILFANKLWTQITGLDLATGPLKAFWQVYTTPGKSQHVDPATAFQPAIAAQQAFCVDVVICGGNGKQCWDVTFKPAGREPLDGAMQPVLIPALEGAEDQHTERFWFGCVEPSGLGSDSTDGPSADGSTRGSAASSSTCLIDPRGACPFTDVQLGALLGRGSFGSVYRGTWYGTAVAVKVVEHQEAQTDVKRANEVLEGMLGMKLMHPNVVRAYKYTTASRKAPVSKKGLQSKHPTGSDQGPVMPTADARASAHSLEAARAECAGTASLPSVQTITETWILMELCGGGNLQSAIERGRFRSEKCETCQSPQRLSVYGGGVNMLWVLLTASEIASAMAYLHSQDILHGDLNASNVLLVANTTEDGRPFATKVSDFGLSRILIGDDAVKTASFGTVTCMPPELFREGRLSKAADVYAFGILLWSLYTGQRPWAGLRNVAIIAKKMMGNASALEFPDHTPPAYKELAEQCMASDDRMRPTFAEAAARLRPIQEAAASGLISCASFPVYQPYADKGRPVLVVRDENSGS